MIELAACAKLAANSGNRQLAALPNRKTGKFWGYQAETFDFFQLCVLKKKHREKG